MRRKGKAKGDAKWALVNKRKDRGREKGGRRPPTFGLLLTKS